MKSLPAKSVSAFNAIKSSIKRASIKGNLFLSATSLPAKNIPLFLKKHWNDNNTNPFPANLIEKCANLISQLEVQPFISPTACGAIQIYSTYG
ncbi:hypothetical protein AAK894_13200 [Lachnospiraceae bacterium 46-61]